MLVFGMHHLRTVIWIAIMSTLATATRRRHTCRGVTPWWRTGTITPSLVPPAFAQAGGPLQGSNVRRVVLLAPLEIKDDAAYAGASEPSPGAPLRQKSAAFGYGEAASRERDYRSAA